jgi:hypothetical protein
VFAATATSATVDRLMSFTTLYSSTTVFRATLKTLVFVFSSFAAIFCASTGYGLLKMLLPALSVTTDIGFAEFFTHSGLTIVFFVLAGLTVYLAKKCFW